MKQQMLNLLEETVKYYQEDTNRRALDPILKDYDGNPYCTYFDPETKNKCAIGRLLNEEDLQKIILNGEYKTQSFYGLKTIYGFRFTTPILNQLPDRFFYILQSLHDKREFWDEKGLTNIGLRYYEDIKETVKYYQEDTNGWALDPILNKL